MGILGQDQQIAESEQKQPRRWDPFRKFLWIGLAALVVAQVYFVRELIAALVLFTGLFVVLSVIAGVVYLVGRVGESTISMAEPAAKRGLEIAEEVSKKTFRRPRSAPAP
ncbi:MAG: hypothetical protein ACRD5L_09045 [Bryobacteraceae bacterium]